MQKKNKEKFYIFLDKVEIYFYYLVVVATLVISIGMILSQEIIQNKYGFLDASIIANTPHEGLGIILLLPLFIFVGIPFIALSSFLIPGVSKTHTASNYKKKPKKKKEKTFNRKLFVIWFVIAILLIGCCLFSLVGRDCMKDDYQIISYNNLNRVTHSYTTEDYNHLTIRATGGTKHTFPTYKIILEMSDGKDYHFDCYSFANRNSDIHQLALTTMLEIKELFPAESIKIDGLHRLNVVIGSTELDTNEIELLYKLFDAPI